ncbi:MAG TPA: RsmG family class I SAM-dependent methyltransferase [Polyangia bacterium]|jgi:16S rRNA (guanine527-N7)-methyltransferase|nr:RsmG family class I SAM-dependent methyltransferase [Polyangia bacterium]
MFATEARSDERTHQLVRTLASAWSFPADDAQVAALVAYGDMLLRWTARINLTAARSIDVLVGEHFPDAFALARRLEGTARLDRVVDVGSGGGLPAIPLALLRPGLSVELVEPIAKKAAFLRTAIRDLALGDRVSVRMARGEAVARAIAADRPSAFDVAISRATLAPAKWLALGVRLVRPGGRVFVLTTADALPELPDREVYFDGRRSLIEVVAP